MLGTAQSVRFAASPTVLAGASALVLAGVHVFASRFCIEEGPTRSRLLSLGGGVSVSYVFVHLLPELAAGTTIITAPRHSMVGVVERHVYLIALFGLVAFYGLERFVSWETSGDEFEPSEAVFWVHIASFGAYNALIGYLLVHRESPGIVGLLLFAVAMAFHFFVNDIGLYLRHYRIYERRGRWILAVAVLVGASVGLLVDVSEQGRAVLFAFLAGGIVLNSIKEELPEHCESRFWPFAVGAGGYAFLLLFL